MHPILLPEIITAVFQKPITQLKAEIITGHQFTQSFGLKQDLGEHALMLKKEFSGKSELLLYHALLNVLIRRDINLLDCLERFFELWQLEGGYLLDHLNSRWLISACDTIIDHSPSESEKAYALSACILVNTCKLYETERLGMLDYKSVKINGPMELFNGISAFCIGSGDMIFNLNSRLNQTTNSSKLAGKILIELFRRISIDDTVYKRFKNLHNDPKTIW